MPRIRFFSLGFGQIFLKIRHSLSSASNPSSRALTRWRALYVAALYEKDQGRMIARIDEAKKILVVRARELFLADGDHQQEQAAIDDALQFLHLLEKCTVHPRAVQ
jgi:hypothetical protein